MNPPSEHHRKRTARGNLGQVSLAVFIFFAAYYVLFYHGHFTGSDEVHTYETARSLLDKGSLAIPPILNSKQGTDGLYYSKYGLGHSVIVMPFYGLGKLMAEWLPPAWRELVGG